MRSRRRVLINQQGFSLIELMIAAAVLFLALVIALEASSNLNQSNELAHQSVVALQDAQRAIEEMRRESTIGTFPNNVTAKYPNGQAIAGYTTLTNEQVVPTYVNTTADPLSVTVTVTWDAVVKGGAARTQSTQLTTLLTKR